MKTKKFLGYVVAVLFMVVLFQNSAYADTAKSGTIDGTTIEWEIVQEEWGNELYVHDDGTSEYAAESYSELPWSEYDLMYVYIYGNIQNIDHWFTGNPVVSADICTSTITSAKMAFKDCTKLEQVLFEDNTWPKDCTEMLYGCTSLARLSKYRGEAEVFDGIFGGDAARDGGPIWLEADATSSLDFVTRLAATGNPDYIKVEAEAGPTVKVNGKVVKNGGSITIKDSAAKIRISDHSGVECIYRDGKWCGYDSCTIEAGVYGTINIIAEDTLGHKTNITVIKTESNKPKFKVGSKVCKDGNTYNIVGKCKITIVDQNSSGKLYVNGKKYNRSYTLTKKGTYTVKATDVFKNTSIIKIKFYEKDTTKPKITGVTNNKTYTKAPTIKVSDISALTAYDNGVKCKIKDNKVIWSKTAGKHTIKVKDASKNVSTVKFTYAPAK